MSSQPPFDPSGQQPYFAGQTGPGPQNSGAWGQQPMDAAQAAAQSAMGPGPVLVTIGDIVCTSTTVITPSGQVPVGSVVWSYTDMSRTNRTIPTWAVVLAVVFFFFCLLGLLFLLVKEDKTEGSVQVVVQGPGFLHQIQLPVASIGQVQDYAARVNYARSLSVSAAGR